MWQCESLLGTERFYMCLLGVKACVSGEWRVEGPLAKAHKAVTHWRIADELLLPGCPPSKPYRSSPLSTAPHTTHLGQGARRSLARVGRSGLAACRREHCHAKTATHRPPACYVGRTGGGGRAPGGNAGRAAGEHPADR